MALRLSDEVRAGDGLRGGQVRDALRDGRPVVVPWINLKFRSCEGLRIHHHLPWDAGIWEIRLALSAGPTLRTSRRQRRWRPFVSHAMA